MIRTLEELEALSKDTPIRDALGFVWGSADEAAEYAEEYGTESVLPAVQLIPVTVSREQFEDSMRALLGNPYTNWSLAMETSLKDALAALGIEVDDMGTVGRKEAVARFERFHASGYKAGKRDALEEAAGVLDVPGAVNYGDGGVFVRVDFCDPNKDVPLVQWLRDRADELEGKQ